MNRIATLTVLVVGISGCDDSPFDPRTLIQEPRLLAVRADPPVVTLGDRSTLEALVVDADGGELAADVHWRACDPWRFVLDPERDCPVESALRLEGTLDVGELLDAYPPPGEAGGLAPDGPPVDEECGDAPLELGVPIVAEASVDGRRIVAIRYVPLRLETAGRTNPSIAALLLDDGDASAELEPGREYSLTVSIDPESLDAVCVGAEPTRETVRVHLYTSAGELGDSSVDLDPGEAMTSSWVAPMSGRSTIWAIAIDGDGGVDWRHVVLRAR